MAKIRSDWDYTPPGLLCDECGERLETLCAYDTGDGWLFFWSCEDLHEQNDDTKGMIEGWIFAEDYVTGKEVTECGLVWV